MFYSKTCYVVITELILNEIVPKMTQHSPTAVSLQLDLFANNSPREIQSWIGISCPPMSLTLKTREKASTRASGPEVHRSKFTRRARDADEKAGKVGRSFLRFVFGMLRGSFSLAKMSKFWKIALFGLGCGRDICGFRKQLKWDELY